MGDPGSTAGEGATLHAVVDGRDTGPRIVLVHGFTQTRDCWGSLPGRLVAAGFEVVRVDLPGHGRSGGADDDLARTAERLGRAGGRATYLGYSFGARVCLHLALDRPDLVARLVLVGGTPGIRDAAERLARRTEDEARAARIEAIGVDAFLDEWLDLPLLRSLPPAARGLDARRENTAAGLAASLRACGTGRQEPLWDRLVDLAAPMLLVTGADDEKFSAIAREMVATVGATARHVELAGAGHTAHLEDPDAFWGALHPFLAEPGS